MDLSKGLLPTDLLDLPPTLPRSDSTPLRSKLPKKRSDAVRELLFTPSRPLNDSSILGASSKARPKVVLGTLAKDPAVDALKTLAASGSWMNSVLESTLEEPCQRPSAKHRLPESQGSVAPDSQPEREVGPSDDSDGSMSEQIAPTKKPGKPPVFPARVKGGRVLAGGSDSEPKIKPPRRASPKKKRIYYSSTDEDEPGTAGPSTSTFASPIATTPPLKDQSTQCVVSSDSEDDRALLATVPELVRRKPSLKSIRGKDAFNDHNSDIVVIAGEGEVIPETQSDHANWSDDAAEMGYVLSRSIKKTLAPEHPVEPMAGASSPIIVPPQKQTFRGLGLSFPPSDPYSPAENLITEGSPCKVPPASRAVRSLADDKEIVELSSGSENDDEPMVRPPPAPPKAKIKSILALRDEAAGPSTPKGKEKGKSRTKGPVTPTSPTGKAMTKVAKARYLEHYAQELFDELNETVFDHVLDGCEVTWSKLLSSTAGKAYFKKARAASGVKEDVVSAYSLKIELSTKVVDCEERVRNTLSHEMCHLSTWLVDGIGNPDHGAAWKKWANKVTRKRSDIEITTRHTYEIAYKYSWKCTNTACGHIYGRFSKSIDTTAQGCGLCRSVLRPLFETKVKKSAWQEFMKENLKTVKSQNPSVTQSQAMQILAEKWKQSKDASGGEVETVDDLVAEMGRLLG
ncbi:hypothetical protein FRB95_013470 [Tulasnella sp. JGI-2019a]|nr:hypothetical protein FRB95_013470 [Tulasnella sp. JGI-2019a]